MAIDSFLKLTGPDIKGECEVKGFEGQIMVLAWSWGLSQTGTMHHGTGGGAGKVNVQDLSFTQYIDSSTPALVDACCRGKHIEEGVLTLRKAGGDPLPYLTVKLKNILVSSISTGSSSGEERQTANVSLNFASFEFAYQEQDEKGKKKGGEKMISYDIAKVA